MSKRDEVIKQYGKEAARWTDAEINLYAEVGKVPDKTKRGNWVTDITRSANVATWSETQLLDFYEGRLILNDDNYPEDLHAEIYRRWKIPGNWTEEGVATFLSTGTRPEEVEPGILKDDRIRNEKTLSQLSYTDFRLMLNKLIPSKYTDEEIINEIRSRMKLSDRFPDARILETLPYAENDRSMTDNLLTAKLKEYKEVRIGKGGKVSIETHAAAQTGFFRTIMSVIARPYPEFEKGWNEILDFINLEYNTLFVPLQSAKGISESALNPTEKSIFADLLNLMVHTRAPARRKMEARLYSLPTILRNVKNENARNNVIQYYSLD